MRIGDWGGRRHLSPLGSFRGLSPSRFPTLASHPLPNPNSSSPASGALSSITNNNDAYQTAWTYPTSSDPAPLPWGPLPSYPGIRCWRTDSWGPVGRPGHGPLHTSLYLLCG